VKVRSIMTQPAIVVREDATLEEVARTMLHHRVGCLPVVDREGRVEGIITAADLGAKRRSLPFCAVDVLELFGDWMAAEGVERTYAAARRRTAREVMSRRVVFVSPDAPVEKLMEMMARRGLSRIPVVHQGVPVGVVARHDLLKLMAACPGGA